MAEELTVAAVTELPIAGVGGGRGAGAALRAAILFLSQTLIGLTGQATVCKFVPLAPRVPAAREKGPEVRVGGVGTEQSRSLEKHPSPQPPFQLPSACCINASCKGQSLVRASGITNVKADPVEVPCIPLCDGAVSILL